MQSRAEGQGRATRVMALAMIAALAMVFLRSAMVAPGVAEHMTVGGNDSIMRLLSVRDWLNGQGWFDMSNARVLPPEGLSLHWSRYVDAGIAGVIGALSLVMPYAKAEALALVVWPGLLLVCFLTLTLIMTRRLFGPLAATVAVLAIVLWRLTAFNYFGPAQLDHHGLQILLLAVVVFSLVADGSEVRRGVIGGLAAALSLAVGLENLLPIASAGAVLAVLAVVSPERGGRQLTAFGLTLAGAAVLLYAGQTARAEWRQPQCDELGPPVLGLVGFAAVAAALIGSVVARSANLRLRIAATAGIAGLAAVGAYWIMQACPNFPYGNLPDSLREMINLWIVEARPALSFFATGEPIAFTHILTTFATTLVATGLLAWRCMTGAADPRELRAVAILLVFAWIGTLGSLSQVRLNVLSAPVIPVLMGYAVAALVELRNRVARPSFVSLAVVGFLAAALVPGQLHDAYRDVASAHASDGSGAETTERVGETCRRSEIITSLDSLPQGRILAPISLGPPILHGTRHTVVSAPYHRSAEALGNGILPFVGGAEDFRSAIDRSAPDYVVLCNGGHYGDGAAFVNAFARGEAMDGFTRLDGFDPSIIVLQVIP
jgi:hypothetical protein